MQNSLSPCTVHELRTSYDHILKGAEQLSKIRDALHDPGFREYMQKKIGWQKEIPAETISCIVTGNRMFGGYRIGEHTVRPIYELSNIVSNGRFRTSTEEYRLWHKGFDIDKVISYLRDDGLHRLYFDAMVDEQHIYRFKHMNLICPTYALHYDLLYPNLPKFWGPPISDKGE